MQDAYQAEGRPTGLNRCIVIQKQDIKVQGELMWQRIRASRDFLRKKKYTSIKRVEFLVRKNCDPSRTLPCV